MSLRDELQRPQIKALLIAGGVLLLLAVVVYFATKKKGALAGSNPNGLNADASGQVPTVIVLPPVIFGPADAPTVQPPLPAPSNVPGPGGPIPPLPAGSPPPSIAPGMHVMPPSAYR